MIVRKLFCSVIVAGLIVSVLSPSILVSWAGVSPVADFVFTPQNPLPSGTVVFDSSSSYDPDGTIVSYTWNFGDGSPTESLPTPLIEHQYSALGNYTVTLVVTDNSSLTDSFASLIWVIDYPVANFMYSSPTPLVDETVVFNASTSEPNGGTIVCYCWDFGDGTETNTSTPIAAHSYAAVGNYLVTLLVIDSENLTDESQNLVLVINYPTADFTYTPAYPLVDEVVMFNASQSHPDGGTIVEYLWSFGDGHNASGLTTTHAYVNFGTYLVNLTVVDSEDLSDNTTQQIAVRQHPVADFTYSPTYPLVDELITFNASQSTPNGGVLVSYNWDFGDGNTTTISTPIISHKYPQYGTYLTTLTVTDSEGLSSIQVLSLRVLIRPTANFTFSPIHATVNQPVLFNASSASDPDGVIISYEWTFDDGNTTTIEDPVVSHVYEHTGTYTITLQIVDDDGLNDNTTRNIVVYTIVPIHDVAVLQVAAEASWAYTGNLVNITTVAANEGNIVEKFNVTVYINSNGVETLADIILSPGENLTWTFTLNTSSMAPGVYLVSAEASIVYMEEDTADNLSIDGTLTIVSVDVNGDGKVDIKDIARVAKAFGSSAGSPNWDPLTDLSGDGKVDIRDIAQVAVHFGEEY